MEAREIKFRAWDGVRMRGTGKNDWFSLRSDGMISFGQADDPKVHLMQYTGLKDAKGVEIYEGDIVKFYEGRRIDFADVRYSDIYGYWFANNCEGARFHSCEVIGNIHQHPHLLEQTA